MSLQTKRIAEADELATALPSVKYYGTGGAASVVDLLSAGWALRAQSPTLQPGILYTAENHNHAAEILGEALIASLGGNPAPDWAELWGADRANSPEGRELSDLINSATTQLVEKGL